MKISIKKDPENWQRYARRMPAKAGEKVKQKGRTVDALALRADERRDKLRKAAGRSTCPVIRRCLNGETHMENLHVSLRKFIA